MPLRGIARQVYLAPWDMHEAPSLIVLVQNYQQAGTREASEAAADAVVRRADPNFWLFLMGRCDPTAQPDIIQDTWLAIFQRLDAFVGNSDAQVWGWFYKILSRRLMDHYRRQARNPAAPWTDPAALIALITLSVADEALRPDEWAMIEDELQQLSQVDPRTAEFMWRHYVLDQTHAEIGAMWNVTADVVRMRIKRCVEQFKLLAVKGD